MHPFRIPIIYRKRRKKHQQWRMMMRFSHRTRAQERPTHGCNRTRPAFRQEISENWGELREFCLDLPPWASLASLVTEGSEVKWKGQY